MAIFWAAVNMMLAAGNDFAFKCYARKPRSQGVFVSIIGVFWFITALFFVREMPSNLPAVILWGCVSGIFSLGGNLLMLEAMRTLDAGICATIYRLNLVPVTIGAALILGERLQALQYAGIVMACIAVLAFIPDRAALKRGAAVGMALMIVASLMRAGMGLSYKYGFSHGADQNAVVLCNSVFWIVGGAVYALFCGRRDRERRIALFSGKTLGYGVLSGVLVSGICLTMAASLARGEASVVLPIMQMSFLLTAVLGAVFLRESLGKRKIAAILSGMAAILLLCS